MYRAEQPEMAAARLSQAMLLNRYLLPRLLGRDEEDLHVSPDSDELEIMALDQIPAEFFELWSLQERLWASTLYDGQLLGVRVRYLEVTRRLEHGPRGERRNRLVREAHGLKYGR